MTVTIEFGANGSDTLRGDDEDDSFSLSRIDRIRDPNPEPGRIARDISVPDENPETYIGGGGIDQISLSLANDPLDMGFVVDLGAGTTDHGDIVLSIENILASGLNDILAGSGVANVIRGRDGDDRIFGRGGFDSLEGGSGDDRVFGGPGNDILRGNDGSDVLRGGIGADTLWGTFMTEGDGLRGGDSLFGEDGPDELWALGSEAGNLLDGGPGRDILRASAADDTLIGGPGADILNAESGNDRLFGGSAADILNGDLGDDLLEGQLGFDRLFGGGGQDTLRGGLGPDTLDGGDGLDTMFGGPGNDEILFREAGEVIDGGADLDRVVFVTSTADLSIIGDKGGAWLVVDRDADTIVAEFDNIERIKGSSSDDLIQGTRGNDTILGGFGEDVLAGGRGTNVIKGEDGDDILNLGQGRRDIAYGGDDNDIFVIEVTPGEFGASGARIVAIADLDLGDDRILLEGVPDGISESDLLGQARQDGQAVVLDVEDVTLRLRNTDLDEFLETAGRFSSIFDIA